MGAEAVRSLAKEGKTVIMACRNLRKGESVRQEILSECPGAQLRLEILDLSSLQSVRDFASRLIESGEKIHGLFNNAGVISRGYSVTGDGYENTLQVNCLAPALLTLLLLPCMAEGAHIVNMVSLTCRFGRVEKDIFEKKYDSFNRLAVYSDTKLAFLLFSIALSGHCRPDIRVNVADPGIVDSNMISMGKWFDPLADLLFRPFCSSPEKGVSPALKALHSGVSGHYFVGGKHSPIASGYSEHPLVEWVLEKISALL